MKKMFLGALLCMVLCMPVSAQNSSLTKESVLNMSIEELSDLPLEDLMYAVELLEVKSVDELFAMIMNKNVSSASKKVEDSFKSPLSTSVITRDEMRTYGCTSIEEALRFLPGVIVREKTNGVYDVHLRGLDNIPDGAMLLYTENVNTLVMVDGRPVFNYGQGATMWETLPVGIEDIERIEVVRGPSSALYGSNAVTGVINIITENPNTQSKIVSGTLQSGSQNTYVGDIAFRKAFNDKWAVSVSGNYQMRNRPTNQIYLMPNSSIYDPDDESIDFSEGRYVNLSDMHTLKTSSGDVFNSNIDDIDAMFSKSELARKSLGFNAHVAYTPKADIRVDLTGGYQSSLSLGSSITSDLFPMYYRQSKQYYVNMIADVKGINLQLNYTDGPQNFKYGAPSFKVRVQQFTANLEYDWQILDNLSVRPGVNYRLNKIDDSDYQDDYGYDADGNYVQLSGYFNGDPTLNAFAPSVRVDYTLLDRLRLVGAYRIEKLEIPDKWYSSWQVAASVDINENNNFRAIYSRANRSAIFANSSSNYTQLRSSMGVPDEILVLGNEEADIMYADNFEVGYRWRPFSSVIIDAEAFYNISKDYGSLTASSSSIVMDGSKLSELMVLFLTYGTSAFSSVNSSTEMYSLLSSYMNYQSILQYKNQPYEVKQQGVSLSLDWILSKKLILKFNGNIQKTKIDNYYTYTQSTDILNQLTTTAGNFVSAMSEMYQVAMSGMSLTNLLNYTGDYSAQTAEYQAALAESEEAGAEYLSQYYNDDQINYYFAIKYNIGLDQETNRYSIGSSATTEHELEDGHKHKATPSFYGNVGLIWKPLEQLSIAAHGYFYGKQTTTTCFGTAKTDGKFIANIKVGYKPTEQFEIYFNAHNLFDDTKREFVYGDRVRGIYSVGINFGF